jgi:DNA polymerase I-like protein with 3'-5' exonuclease and polymerase domains
MLMSNFTRLAGRCITAAIVKTGGLRLAFDAEGNGLVDDASAVHCVVVADLDSDQINEYGPAQITAALEHLAHANYLTGHNISGYDLPLLQRLHNWTPSPDCVVMDTLIASRLILPHLGDLDAQAAAMGDPALGKLRGSHSLEAWGARLGIPKIGAEITDWSAWTPAMQGRCAGDVAICKALWRFLQPDGYSQQALELEHRTLPICNRITADGVPFDREAAELLRQKWEARRTELKAQLQQQLPGTNPNSRLQIGRLLEARGWIPERRTEKKGQPVIDDELLESLPSIYPEFAGLAEHDLLRRRLAQLSNGNQAWLKHIADDGRIHGGLVPIGTPHSRAKHLSPNLAQVPNAKKGGAYAAECRDLFRAPMGWAFVTCDQANLQDRAFAHYLSEFDDGAYVHAFLNGIDQHWESGIALGLVPAGTERNKDSKAHTALREGAKRFRYGFLFGAGNKRAGHIIHDTVRAVDQIDAALNLQQKFFASTSHPNETELTRIGKLARNKFMTATPGLQQLRARLEAQVGRCGWLPGLDGRRVPTQAQYTALNYTVTSAEAIICKRWLVHVYDELCARFRYGWDGDVVIVLWVHDEIAVCCRIEISEQVGEILVRHAKEPGEYYGFKVPLDASYKIGRSWADEPLKDAARDPTANTDKPNEAATCDNQFPTHPIQPAPAQSTPSATMVTNGAAVLTISQITGDKKICCPFHADKTPSCQLYADGHYHCFGCGAHGWIDGDLDVDDAVLATLAARESQDDKEKSRALALRLWGQSVPIAGTTAARYLSDIRGVDLAELPPDIDGALRFHPRCPFGSGVRHPCLIALMRNATTDTPTGIQRVALTPEGSKIDRRMLGYAGAVKLWPAGSQLVVGEGLETVLAAATRVLYRDAPLRPAWSLLSAGALERLPVLPSVKRLIALVDHDSAGKNSAAICASRYQRAGRTVVRLTPTRKGADFNDLVMPEIVS